MPIKNGTYTVYIKRIGGANSSVPLTNFGKFSITFNNGYFTYPNPKTGGVITSYVSKEYGSSSTPTIIVTDGAGNSYAITLSESEYTNTGYTQTAGGWTGYNSSTKGWDRLTADNDAYFNSQLQPPAPSPEKSYKAEVYFGSTFVRGGDTISGDITSGQTGIVHSGGIYHDGTIKSAVVLTESGGLLSGTITVDGNSALSGGTVTSGSTITLQGFSNLQGIVTNSGIISGGYAHVSGTLRNTGTLLGASVSGSQHLDLNADVDNTGGVVEGKIANSGSFTGGTLRSALFLNSAGSIHGAITVDGNSTLDGGVISSDAAVTLQGFSNLQGIVTNSGIISGGYANIKGEVINKGKIIGTAGEISSGGNALNLSANIDNISGELSGNIYVHGNVNGGMASGHLFVLSGATVSDLSANSGAEIDIYAGGIAQNTNVLSGAHGYVYSGGQIIASGGTAFGWDVQSGATAVASAGGRLSQIQVSEGGEAYIQNQGYIGNSEISSGGSIYLGDGATISGLLSLQDGATASLYQNAGGTVFVSGDTNHSLTLYGLTSGGTLSTEIQGFTGMSSGNSDTLKIAGVHQSDVVSVTYPDDDHVTLTLKNGSTITLHIIGAKARGYTLGQASDGNLTYEVCFLEGTLIRTPEGEVAVEDLSLGDVVLASEPDGRDCYHENVIWTGRRHVRVRSNTSAGDIAGYPVRVKKNALSDGIPHKDLLITPEHCLYLEKKFIPVRLLVNGSSIFYDRNINEYTYYHIETSSHSVIWADGALTESYLDTGNRSKFFADYEKNTSNRLTKSWPEDAAAPLAVSREIVEPIFHKIEKRSFALGFVKGEDSRERTYDPQIALLLSSGDKIYPIRSHADLVIFKIPAGSDHVRIMSRAGRPSDLEGNFVDDRRVLGLRVGKIIQFSAARSGQLIECDEANFSNGWHALEGDGSRWTNGDAYINIDKYLSESILAIEVIQSIFQA
ncbi:Hint domain-containing protein [Asaia spathodeae]|uniref:Hint domain-containing protein n=1 Tax=Asaia spathodeae TaxID=657016 RepID=UPI002FC2861F